MTRALRKGEPSVVLSTRLPESLACLVWDTAYARRITPADLIRAAVESFLQPYASPAGSDPQTRHDPPRER